MLNSKIVLDCQWQIYRYLWCFWQNAA